MERLFEKYLTPNAKFVDIGCGHGDALRLASRIGKSCEVWGLDINRAGLKIARERTPEALLFEGDMHDAAPLPKGYFDVVHEFGAAFLSRGWDILARTYMSLLRDDGILLWELPRRWSLGHISYLLTVAPKISDADTKAIRIWRSFLPSKYRFESDTAVTRALENAEYTCEVVENIPIWHFYCPKAVGPALDWLWKYFGDSMFDRLDEFSRRLWRREAGYYLVVRKKAACVDFPNVKIASSVSLLH